MTENKTVDARKVIEHRAASMHLGIFAFTLLGLGIWYVDMPWGIFVVLALIMEVGGYLDFKNYVHKLDNTEDKQ